MAIAMPPVLMECQVPEMEKLNFQNAETSRKKSPLISCERNFSSFSNFVARSQKQTFASVDCHIEYLARARPNLKFKTHEFWVVTKVDIFF